MPDIKMNPWHPMSNPVDLKHLGKFGEELGECASAVSRCIIQGINENEPITGKSNKKWLEEEIADILAGAELVVARFDLDTREIYKRTARKKEQLKSWHDMA